MLVQARREPLGLQQFAAPLKLPVMSFQGIGKDQLFFGSNELAAELARAKAEGGLVFERSALTDEKLCTVAGTVQEVRSVLDEILERGEDEAGETFITIEYPNPEFAQLLLNAVKKLNDLIHPTGFVQRAMLAALRRASGVKGDMADLQAELVNPNQIIVKVDLTGVNPRDLQMARIFLNKTQMVAGILKKLGIEDIPAVA